MNALLNRRKSIFFLWLFLTAPFVFMYCFSQAQETNAGLYRTHPFPDALRQYDVELFRLVDLSYSFDSTTKRSHYDPIMARQFDTTIASFSHLDKALKKKLLSGPATKGQYISAGNDKYIFYTICQAHWCNVTNISILYQPDQGRMVGRLMYACDPHEFGGITKEEMRLISHLNPLPAHDEDCKFAKRRK